MLQRLLKRFTSLLRRSLQARAVISTLALSAIALVILGGFLSFGIGNGLYQTRVQEVLQESERAVIDVQNTFSASSATDEVALQTLMNSVVPKLENSAPEQTRWVAMLRSPGQDSSPLLQSPISASLDTSVISQSIRDRVRTSDGKLVYQSVALTIAGARHAGLVVAASLQIPLAGNYELYLVYDLNHEQQTLDLVQGTLVIGGLVLLLLIALVSYFVSSRITQPIQLAAEVAERIEGGELDERLPEKGEDVLAQLARSFNKMTMSLQRQIEDFRNISKMQQQFVADVSHELRTPLTTIKMADEILYDNRSSMVEPLQKSAEAMHSQINRFEKLLEALLEISRYDAGAVQARLEKANLVETVEAAIHSIETLAKKRGSEIILETSKSEIIAEYDEGRIERLLRNLLANAVEHGDGKPILVSIGDAKNAVAVSVTDHGVGMNREQLDKVFSRFWRGDPARKRSIGGTGLGLAIAQADTTLHNGWLQVWAKPGEGASFRLTLPRHAGAVFSQSPLPLPPKPRKDANA